MKSPIPYYGGKLSLVQKILPLFPKNYSTYTEAFMGGGALFFAKEKSKTEIINDTNGFVTNFFSVLKTDFEILQSKIEATLFSRVAFKVAHSMYQLPHFFTELQKAWAFWVLTTQGFSGMIGSWSYDKIGQKVKAFNNRKLQFTQELSKRLENTQIECNDAVKVIASRDSSDAFHFIDPPYFNADMGHYGGYTESDFENLLALISTLKGKFLLTTYDSPLLDEFVKRNGWYQKRFDRPLTASKSKNGSKRERKIEVVTTNYKIE